MAAIANTVNVPAAIERAKRALREGARIYAEFDRSDPFAYNRAMSHEVNGIATIEESDRGKLLCYGGERFREKRFYVGPDGREIHYDVPSFRNIHRP